jgi:hypothetical protein
MVLASFFQTFLRFDEGNRPSFSQVQVESKPRLRSLEEWP